MEGREERKERKGGERRERGREHLILMLPKVHLHVGTSPDHSPLFWHTNWFCPLSM